MKPEVSRYIFNPTTVKLVLIAAAGLLFSGSFLFGPKVETLASAFGPSPSHTGAPGEGNCTSCHTDFDVNKGPGVLEILGLPSNYSSGQQIAITIKLSQADAVIYGFQMTAINSTGQTAGTFSLVQPDRTQLADGIVSGNLLRNYVSHTSGGLFLPGVFGHNTWIVNWTAPDTSAGKVDFYVAANAANSDGGSSGDYIYVTAKPTSPAGPPVSISGKVTTPAGLPLRNATVILTAPDGSQKSTTTSSFGIYSFSDVPGGPDNVLSVQSKRYRFAPKTLNLTGDLTDVDFVGLE